MELGVKQLRLNNPNQMHDAHSEVPPLDCPCEGAVPKGTEGHSGFGDRKGTGTGELRPDLEGLGSMRLGYA